MGAIVRPTLPTLDLSEVSSGVAVRGRTWMDAASVANYITGRGRTLVPISCGGITIPASTRYTFRFRAVTSASSRARRWQMHFATTSAATGSQLRVRAPAVSGGELLVSVGSERSVSSQFAEYLELATGSGAEEEITIDINNEGSVGVAIIGISCTECPRSRLGLDATDLGVDENTEASREPVYEADNAGLVGVVDVLSNFNSGSRGGMFHYATDTTTALSNSDHTVNTPLLPLSVPILTRPRTAASVTGNVDWRVYCKTDVTGTAGRVRITTPFGTSIITIPTASHSAFAWFPDPAGAADSCLVDCEDPASADGRQTAGTPAWCDMAIDFRRTTATGTLEIAGLSMWDP